MEVDEAITSRRSVRAFRPEPVPRATVEHILRVAARAPSGTNMQPWRVWVVSGAAKSRLSIAIHDARDTEPDAHDNEFRYYPAQWREPYLARRRKIGWDLYGLLGIARDETDKMHRQHGRNFDFFDAPVGLIFTIDRELEIGSWLDFGMFLENVMLAARGQGLDTCPQAAFAPYHKPIRKALGIPDNQVVVCGMSLGHADGDAPENKLTTERMDLDEFVRFVGD
jgi:nitroreductase